MVFRGQPSKACTECRVRRTRCDLLKPSCSQCIRARRSCTGYREDTIFCDESKKLFTQYDQQSREQKEKSSSSSTAIITATKSALVTADSSLELKCAENIALESSDILQLNSGPFMNLVPELGTSAEDQATCFFFGNYVSTNGDLDNTGGNYQYLSNIYMSEPVGPALGECVAALGLLGLANFWRAPTIIVRAKNKYCSALRLVNARLQDTIQAKSDQTPVAILLLGLYETNTCDGPRSIKSWMNHINGVTSIVQLRGKKQLSTPLGRSIFYHIRSHIASHCLQRHLDVPPNIIKWSQTSLEYETPVEVASTKLFILTAKATSIRASMTCFNDFENSNSIIASLWNLDAEFTDWIDQLPTEFDTVKLQFATPNNEVFSDYFDFYSLIWTASIWNSFRCVRIVINELLRHQVLHYLESFDRVGIPDPYIDRNAISGFPAQDQAYHETILVSTTSTLQNLSLDICASVPFYLSTVNSAAPRSLVGNLLLWPLYLAASTTVASHDMREWVLGRLDYIAETMGILLAVAFAETLRKSVDIDELLDPLQKVDLSEMVECPGIFLSE